jgi:phosphohistidine phosphatase
MDLWLVRHGEAVPNSVDPARPLSTDGIRSLSAAASALSGEIGRLDLVATSGKLRARQTAEIFCAAAGYPAGGIEETKALSPDATPEMFLAFIEEQRGRENILCVGHLPSIALIASALLSAGDPLRLVFGAGSVCRIRLDSIRRGAGKLLFFQQK